jgi:hypothetical protein
MHSRLSQGDKTLADLKYSAFVDSLLAAVPEIKRRHDALQEDIGPDVLPYPAVELVLEPFVKNLLRTNADDHLLRRVFTFLEEMARAQDVEVVNLLHIGIFEPWAGDRETLARAWEYMGEITKQIATDAARRLNRGDSPPRASRR